MAPDTNVLLNLYRFQGEAREDLFGALESLRDRLWIPHQVGLEFQRRRIGVIADQEQHFTSTQRDLKRLIDSIREKVEAFPKRIGLDKERTQGILRSIGELSASLNEEVSKAASANEVRLKSSDNDKVLKRLEALVDGRIGEQMAPAELEAARTEALRRVDAGLPPGYEDDGKADPTGDYLVYRQLINEAKQRKLPVVLVTDDEKKDWYRRESGKSLGARPELREEMMTEAGVPFVIMTTETFLRHVKAYLDFNVSSDTIDQARELPGALSERQRASRGAEAADLGLLASRYRENQRECSVTTDLVRRLRDRAETLTRRVVSGSEEESTVAEELHLLHSSLGEAEQRRAALIHRGRELEDLLRTLTLELQVRDDLRTPTEREYYEYLVAHMAEATERETAGDLRVRGVRAGGDGRRLTLNTATALTEFASSCCAWWWS